MTHVKLVLEKDGLLPAQPVAAFGALSNGATAAAAAGGGGISNKHTVRLNLTPSKPLPTILDVDLRDNRTLYQRVKKAQPPAEDGKIVKKTRGGRVIVPRERKEVLKLCRILLRQHLNDPKMLAMR